MDKLKEVTPAMVLAIVVWLLFCTVVIAGISRLLAPFRERFRDTLITKFGMKPICPQCEEFIPEPRPDACPKCGTRFPRPGN